MVPRASVPVLEKSLPDAPELPTGDVEIPDTATSSSHETHTDIVSRAGVPAYDMPLPRPTGLPVEKPLPKVPISEMCGRTPVGQEGAHFRPETPRRATAPESPHTLSPFTNITAYSLPFRPRTRSPYARGHTRSHSSQGTLSAPLMARAHSSPVPDSTGRFIARPSSPSPGHSVRHRSPLRKSSDETFSSFGNSLDIDQTISENSELDLTPRATTDYEAMPSSPSYASHSLTFPRSRRRPASPLSIPSGPTAGTGRTTLRASISTPQLDASLYNESYPLLYSVSSSSVSSTPTSFRSRSPSISSLETIPDTPDAEAEAEHLAKLKAAADREEQSEDGIRRRAGTDAGLRPSAKGDKRKRWSVCGAERRGDLNLETIWET